MNKTNFRQFVLPIKYSLNTAGVILYGQFVQA